MDKRAWKVGPELIDRFLDVLDDNGFKWESGHKANELEPMWKNVTLLFIKEKPKTLVCMRYLYYLIESDKEYNITEVTEKWLDEMENEGVTIVHDDDRVNHPRHYNLGRFLYVVYDWTDRDIKAVSYKRDKAYAKVGEDYLEGETIDDYHVIEIDLERADLLREVKEIEIERKG